MAKPKQIEIRTRFIIGYEDVYIINSNGCVYREANGTLEPCSPDAHGFIELQKNGRRTRYHLGKLVMKHFDTSYKSYLPVYQITIGPDYSVANLTQHNPFK